jgi:hypothetical protein
MLTMEGTMTTYDAIVIGTVMQHAMHIHPTVSEHIPTMLGELRLL